MLELFQTEWCPASRRIRQRLTELGLDYLNNQVPVEREERTVLLALSGSEQAEAHRVKAAKARRRYLEEECGCSPLATR